MNISDEAIDAATAAIMVTEGRTENVRSLAARIVSAAAPFIAADAWDEGLDYKGEHVWPEEYAANPYRSEP